MSMAANERNSAIDFLRAFCVLYIVGYWHLIPYSTAFPGYANYFTEGLKEIVLGAFTLSSGFLLAQRDVGLNPREIFSFYRRRLVRIYPLYLLAVGLFGAAGIASLEQVSEAALLISMFTPPALPTLWFITMIMFFYLVAPFLIYASGNVQGCLLLGAGVLLAFALYHVAINPIDVRIIMYFPAFLFGILLHRQPATQAFMTRWCWVPIALLAPALALSVAGNERSVTGALLKVPLVLAGSGVFLVCANRLASGVHALAVYLLSYASFCTYLFHRIIFKYSIVVYFPADGFYQLIYLLAFSLPATIMVAYVAQKAYDHSVAWANGLMRRAPPAP